VYEEATINFFGTEFLLDGAAIEGLTVGATVQIDQRNLTLSGRLADGSTLGFDLNSSRDSFGDDDHFDSDAVLAVTLVDILPGDYNDDGVVNAADYVVWKNHEGESVALANEDPVTTPGEVTQGDYYVWRHNFGRTIGSGAVGSAFDVVVPEPASATLLALAGLLAAAIWRRR
jgi:hypothetical protein